VNTIHFFYNTALLEEAGVEPPLTYDELIASCEAIAGTDVDLPFTMNLHAGWAWRLEFHNFYASYGGEFFDEDNMPLFNGEDGVRAVEKMVEVIDACMGDEGLIWSIDDSQAGLKNGSLPTASIWASRSTGMDDPDESDVVGLMAYAPALYAEADAPYRAAIDYTDFYVIPANTNVDPDLLFRIIMESTDEESQVAGASLGLYSRPAAAEAEDAAPNAAAALTSIAEGGPNPANPAIATAHAALGEFLPMVGAGQMTPQEALDAAAEKYIEEATAIGYIAE
jgi:ABC-type glycerol-3-phosphate transport system substrate-binding protein